MSDFLKISRSKKFQELLEKGIKDDLRKHPEKIEMLRKVLAELEEDKD